MSRPIEVLDDDVLAAGELLLAAGRRITGWSLRESIGRGRPDRLMLIWNNHLRTGGEGPQSDDPIRPLPPQVESMATEMQGRIASLCSEAWLSLYREVDRAVGARYQADRDELTAVRANCEEEMAGANAAIVAADEHIDSLTVQIAALRTDLAVAADERIRLEERLRMQDEGARLEIARLVRAVAELEAAKAATWEALFQSQQEHAAAREEARAAKQELCRTRDELAAARNETTAVRTQAEAATLELGTARGQIIGAQQTLTKLETEIERLRNRTGRAEKVLPVCNVAAAAEAAKVRRPRGERRVRSAER